MGNVFWNRFPSASKFNAIGTVFGLQFHPDLIIVVLYIHVF